MTEKEQDVYAKEARHKQRVSLISNFGFQLSLFKREPIISNKIESVNLTFKLDAQRYTV